MPAVDEFLHPALLYSGDAQYVDGTVGFVLDGLAAREPVAVAVPPSHLALLRSVPPPPGWCCWT